MAILICRVTWMPSYQSDDEPAVGGGSYVDGSNTPHESLNFLPVGDTYYGFVQNRGKINIERLGGQAGDETTTGVLVVFCAGGPESKEFLYLDRADRRVAEAVGDGGATWTRACKAWGRRR